MEVHVTAKSDSFNVHHLQIWIEKISHINREAVFPISSISLAAAEEQVAKANNDGVLASLAADEEALINYQALKCQAGSKVHVRKMAHIKKQTTTGNS